MNNKEFIRIRKFLGKNQRELAQLLCVSTRAVQSFEQGWRNIQPNVERQLLFLVATKRSLNENAGPCWEIRECPSKWRGNCIAWQWSAGHTCWFINGTYCQGQVQNDWDKKIQLCGECEVFQLIFAEN